ncbi:tetraacyldisaccharide 4'-kinase [Rubrivivax rivuli]|uniref:Tetraacyldisaccharide 4'-kinase n=1 Tax=Rubrivivax rivuli TaxID=1862385 RepID=A0A437RFK9_9BURK|nr:tetraacyldisaccharide 4'-kinase [Rubrivivax rivuli]RVU45560.1 tetraacyldisaccharide 4'-kinase [Rubrivivax rivuli]
MTAPRPRGLAASIEARLQRSWWRPRPDALACLLWPATLPYRLLAALVKLRTPAARVLPVPVLVVGNHVVGGAGKTPTVMALVQALQARGHRPGVISRGHGRSGAAPMAVNAGAEVSEVGDEPLLIQRQCGVPVWVGRQRDVAAMALCAAHPEVDVLVSDDGLQHLALARQAELVVFDERGIGNGLLLPAGPLREPVPEATPGNRRVLYTAGRASTRLPGALAQRQLQLAWPLEAWRTGKREAALPLSALRGRPLLAAAGLAAPGKFFGMLGAAGLQFTPLPLPDHHPYATLPWPADTADVLVTEKDAVKLLARPLGATRVWVLPLDFQVPESLVADLSALLFPPQRPKPTAP